MLEVGYVRCHLRFYAPFPTPLDCLCCDSVGGPDPCLFPFTFDSLPVADLFTVVTFARYVVIWLLIMFVGGDWVTLVTFVRTPVTRSPHVTFTPVDLRLPLICSYPVPVPRTFTVVTFTLRSAVCVYPFTFGCCYVDLLRWILPHSGLFMRCDLRWIYG